MGKSAIEITVCQKFSHSLDLIIEVPTLRYQDIFDFRKAPIGFKIFKWPCSPVICSHLL